MMYKMEVKVPRAAAQWFRLEAKRRGVLVEDLIKESMREYLKNYQKVT
jgi:hypothetical protein